MREAAIIRPEHRCAHLPVKVSAPLMPALTSRVLPRLSHWLLPLRCTLAGALSGALVLAPLPALAADGPTFGAGALLLAPAAPAATAATAAPAAPAVGNVVGLMRFGGDTDAASTMRAQVQTDLEGAGFVVRGVALDIDAASAKVKCRGGGEACAGKVAEWLIKGGSKGGTTYNFLVFGSWSADPSKPGKLIVYDVAQKKKIAEFSPADTVEDLILPLALPRELAAKVKEYQSPPPPATEAELKLIAELDEPAKTPEELRREKELLDAAIAGVDTGTSDSINTDGVTVDLKKDFKEYCRTGPRAPRVNKDDPKDLRPACKLGPKFGYFQTRAWVALGLTGGALITSGLFYALGLAARGPYKDSVKTLEDSGLNGLDPTTSGAYTALAADVAEKGNMMRRRLIGGDVALLTTVLLGAVLGIIIYQDRTDAKGYILEQKKLKLAEGVKTSRIRPKNFRGGPLLGAQMQGVSFGFDF
jgi:hypothetical protein